MPELVEFVQGLERAGMAYQLDGSVYFDTGAFERGNHVYGRLQPSRQHLGADEDAALEAGPSERRSRRDFALWKATGNGADVPTWRTAATWPSPWGPGRPGWHIECSVMATCVCVVVVVGGGVRRCRRLGRGMQAQNRRR